MTTEVRTNLGELALRCLGAIYFGLISLASLTDGLLPLVQLSGVVAVVLLVPPLAAKLHEKTGLEVRGKALVLAVVVLFFVQAFGIGRAGSKPQETVAAARSELDAARLAKERPAVLAEIAAFRTAGDFDKARGRVNKYLAVAHNDAELIALRDEIAKEKAYASLKHEGNLSLKERVEMYSQLVKYEPKNKEFVAAEEQASEELKLQNERDAEEQRRIARAASQEQRMKEQFSAWDGSHHGVVAAVKATMKNPASFEHVETRYVDTGKGLRVIMTFRGTNSFGGVVPNRVIAEVDDAGQVLALSSVD